jgi:hypothetical protein
MSSEGMEATEQEMDDFADDEALTDEGKGIDLGFGA